MVDISFDASVPNLQAVVPQVNGPLAATGTVRQTEKGFFVDTNATGPYGARAMVEGLATGPDMSLTFDVSVPNVQPLVPGVSGPLAAKGSVRQTPAGIAVDTNATGPYAARASVQGVVTGDAPALNYDVTIPNLGAVVPKLSGPLNVSGTAQQESAGLVQAVEVHQHDLVGAVVPFKPKRGLIRRQHRAAASGENPGKAGLVGVIAGAIAKPDRGEDKNAHGLFPPLFPWGHISVALGADYPAKWLSIYVRSLSHPAFAGHSSRLSFDRAGRTDFGRQ
jgi:hypothetical protein